mmetsp:Transcript_83267/g.156698  ORF Transcript_83267/g.156698 Transcript_83267/m.156698 type:complete len:389 (-) Transcript_83267:23-1189(-)
MASSSSADPAPTGGASSSSADGGQTGGGALTEDKDENTAGGSGGGDDWMDDDFDFEWDHENTHVLDKELAESRRDRVQVIPAEVSTSVSEAVMMLQDGEIECKAGYCICYSESKAAWYLIYRNETALEAFREFDIDPMEHIDSFGRFWESDDEDEMLGYEDLPSPPGGFGMESGVKEAKAPGTPRSSSVDKRAPFKPPARTPDGKAPGTPRRTPRGTPTGTPRGTPREMGSRIEALKAKFEAKAAGTPPGTPKAVTPRSKQGSRAGTPRATTPRPSESKAPGTPRSMDNRMKAISEKLAAASLEAKAPGAPGTPRSLDTRMNALRDKLSAAESKAPGTPRSMDARMEALKAKFGGGGTPTPPGTPRSSRRPSREGRRPSRDRSNGRWD